MTMVAIDVPGATAISMPPNRALGLPEQRYVPENGYIDVERPDHVAAFEGSGQMRVERARHGFSGAAGRVVCQGCCFNQFEAFRARPCPRCGMAFAC